MASIVGLLGVAVVVGWTIWILMRGAPAMAPPGAAHWQARFEDGQVVGFDGAFPPPGWREAQEIARARRTTGSVSVGTDGVVVFSGEIPDDDRQRFRNVLAPRATRCGPGPEG